MEGENKDGRPQIVLEEIDVNEVEEYDITVIIMNS